MWEKKIVEIRDNVKKSLEDLSYVELNQKPLKEIGRASCRERV